MRLHASRKRLWDRPLRSCASPLLCDPCSLEWLECGEDIVVYLEALTRRLPSEISAMGTEPPVSRAVPLVSSKRLIDLEERLNRYLGGSADEPWTTYAVKHDDEIACCGIGSRPSRYRANSLPRKGRRFAASRARRHQIGKSRRFFPGLTRSPRDHLWMNSRVENVSVQTALSTDRRLTIRGSFHS
jgi:hypothetical protein